MRMLSINHQASYESDVWNSFNALGLGYSAYLYRANRTGVWLRRPDGTNYGEFYVKEGVIDFLIKKGLVQRNEDKLNSNITFRYELTEEGKALYSELAPSENFRERFIKRVRPVLE